MELDPPDPAMGFFNPQIILRNDMQLRPYQVDLVNKASLSLRKHRKSIIHAPTGAGKSLMATEIKNRALAKGNTVLILSESITIFNQLKRQLEGEEINSQVKHLRIQPGKCYVAMIQTLRRRPLIVKQLHELGSRLVVLIDECHISISRELINELEEAYIGGLTATPFGIVHKHLSELYNDLVEGPQVDYLIQERFLCTYKHIARSGADINLLELRNGEYTEASQDKVFASAKLYDGLKDDLRTVPFKKCVIFVASIKQANTLNSELLHEGFSSVTYHSGLENGAYELAKFTELNLANIIVTIKSLSKGWDFPPVDLIVLMHKTSSPSLYLQEIGRGSRVIPNVKETFTVLDYGENWRQHGLYWEDREYNKLWKQTKRKRKSEGVAPVVMCPSCEAILPATTRKCPYCGNIRPLTEQELQKGELVEITSHYTQLIGRRISSLTPVELAIYAKLKSKQRFAARIARSLDQKKPGYLMHFAAQMGYKNGWIDRMKATIQPGQKIDFADIILR